MLDSTGEPGCVHATHLLEVHPKGMEGKGGYAAYRLHEPWAAMFYANKDN